ncbi:fumarate hydratase [Brumimicrobium glaciale]|uniref:fumarate hydratase n=1 Tax=Brumimicrobium glaciale TaxID=200475 RepID=UPI001A911A7B|nr:fumarate hydratase [Brumimicrobium glaciale]
MISKVAVISGDILASTSLDERDRTFVIEQLQTLLNKIESKYEAYCRIVQGDYIECVTPHSEKAIEIALILKSYIKALPISNNPRYENDNRVKAFRTYGIRIAIGYGEINRIDPEQEIIDGEAIYMSGRFLKEHSTHDKERMNVRTTLNFISKNEHLNDGFNSILSLIEVLINKATAKQSDVLYRKLIGQTENEIAKQTNVSQPVINRQSTSIGWNAIEQGMMYYEKVILQNRQNNFEWTSRH